MGHQLTTWLHRAVPGVAGLPPSEPVRPGGSGDLRREVAARVRRLLPADDRERYDALLATAGRPTAAGDATAAPGRPGEPSAVVILERTLAATRSVSTVTSMAELLTDGRAAEDAAARTTGRPTGHGGAGVLLGALVDPVRALGPVGRQHDSTTCGSAALLMLAAHGDPVLALWLATGRRPGAGRRPDVRAPAEVHGLGPRALADLATAPAERRFVALQQALKRRTNVGALLGLTWPHALGTPPWGAARAARFLGLTYRHAVLDDTDPVHLDRALGAVRAAVARGVPVPLYSGGDSGRGWSSALPRHVVLVVGRTDDCLTVWEPSSGRLEQVATAALLRGGQPLRALGGWSHLSWAVLPRL